MKLIVHPLSNSLGTLPFDFATVSSGELYRILRPGGSTSGR